MVESRTSIKVGITTTTAINHGLPDLLASGTARSLAALIEDPTGHRTVAGINVWSILPAFGPVSRSSTYTYGVTDRLINR
jgi:hypothetical protein